MSQITTAECYIEEYESAPGRPGARLREKITGRKVNLGFASPADSEHFLVFLNAAREQRAVMPKVYDKDDLADAVAVTGNLESENADEISFVHNEELQYLFV
jgi:hypothetical protein